MILSDREIAAALEHRHITIEPRPGPELWTSTAIDLTLDGVLLKWKEPKAKPTGEPIKRQSVFPAREGFDVQAMTVDQDLAERIQIPSDGYPLQPGEFVLGFTSQHIFLPLQSRIAARVEGKSSLARIGVGVHVTAPTIHAGFGFNKAAPEKPGLPIQLEVFNLGSFIVHLDAGMPICQIILEEVREMPIKGYLGRFASQEPFRVDE
jgi:dCTP deaminase